MSSGVQMRLAGARASTRNEMISDAMSCLTSDMLCLGLQVVLIEPKLIIVFKCFVSFVCYLTKTSGLYNYFIVKGSNNVTRYTGLLQTNYITS